MINFYALWVVSERNLILVGLLLSNPRAFDASPQERCVLSGLRRRCLTSPGTSAALGVSPFRENAQSSLINCQQSALEREKVKATVCRKVVACPRYSFQI